MAISWVGGTANHAASAATLTATYSPTAGNIVIVFVAVGGAVTLMSVQDNNGNYLLQGPVFSTTVIPVAAGTGQLYAFWGIAAAGATGYTATWTTNEVSSVAVGEYSGVEAIYYLNASTTYYNTGTSATAATAAITTLDANDWVVAGLANNATKSWTAIAGTNLREDDSTETASIALVDSGDVASVAATTLSATQSGSTTFGTFALQLRPFAGAAAATGIPEVMNSITGGLNLIKAASPGTGNLQAGTGLIYGNVLEPYGQMWPRFS